MTRHSTCGSEYPSSHSTSVPSYDLACTTALGLTPLSSVHACRGVVWCRWSLIVSDKSMLTIARVCRYYQDCSKKALDLPPEKAKGAPMQPW